MTRHGVQPQFNKSMIMFGLLESNSFRVKLACLFIGFFNVIFVCNKELRTFSLWFNGAGRPVLNFHGTASFHSDGAPAPRLRLWLHQALIEHRDLQKPIQIQIDTILVGRKPRHIRISA